MSSPRILAFDTSGPWCTAAVSQGDQIMACRHVEMKKGQAEALMPLLDEIMAAAALDYEMLDALGVGVGPGNFTGIRIAVSAARGLALGLGIPAAGISAFAMTRDLIAAKDDGALLTWHPAPRNQIYWQITRGGAETKTGIAPASDVPQVADHASFSGVLKIRQDPSAGDLGIRGATPEAGATARWVETFSADAAAALCRITNATLTLGLPISRPAPLYVRPADAAPARDTAPKILS